MKTNCYHGRDSKGVKLFGGMLHAETLEQAQERATCGLTIKETNSGRFVFADKQGREVSLYLSVHPEHTALGQREIARIRKENAEREAAAEKIAQERTDRLEALIARHGEQGAIDILSRTES